MLPSPPHDLAWPRLGRQHLQQALNASAARWAGGELASPYTAES